MVKKFIPEGVADVNSEQFEQIRLLQDRMGTVFKSYGYNQIQTPTFEYYDLFAGIDLDMETEQMYKLMDTSGKLMVLRPDATIPISRMVATHYKELTQDLKYMYFTNVFRSAGYKSGEKREFIQAGIEYFGNPKSEADSQVIETAIEAVKAAGVSGLKVELGNSNYFNGLIAAIEKDCPGLINRFNRKQLKDLVDSKNLPGLKRIAQELKLDGKLEEVLMKLPLMYGSIEQITSLAKSFALNDEMKQAVDNVIEVYNNIHSKEYISVDMSLVNQLDYYTGMTFKVYLKNTGLVVGSGGRYDGLMKRFGRAIPATGFGLNVDVLYDAYQKNVVQEEQEKVVLSIALGKGRLADTTMAQLKTIGVKFPDYTKESRKLIFDDSTGTIRIVFVKAVDVGIYVEKGACDVGIIGKDTLMESNSDVYEMLDLNYGKCVFAVASLKGFQYDKKKKLRIATKYPNVAKAHFESEGRSIETIKINGSVELAPIVGLADAIVDIVETGSTIRENGLEIIEKIEDISARFIVNKASLKTKQKEVDEIMKALKSCIEKDDADI